VSGDAGFTQTTTRRQHAAGANALETPNRRRRKMRKCSGLTLRGHNNHFMENSFTCLTLVHDKTYPRDCSRWNGSRASGIRLSQRPDSSGWSAAQTASLPNAVDLRKLWGKRKYALLNWWAIPGWSAHFRLQKSLQSTVLPSLPSVFLVSPP